MARMDAIRALIKRCVLPQPGPQSDAYFSHGDQVLFGGAAGGGKTALAIALAINEHERTLFIREEAKQLIAVVDEMTRMLGYRTGYNGQERVWRFDGSDQRVKARSIQFGGIPNLGDETAFQGNPRDLLVLDEAANLLEAQVRFLMGWVRTTTPGQRCRVLLCSNPPTSDEGEWIVRWFAPWLDEHFANPAVPGELRWVLMMPGGAEEWVDGPGSTTTDDKGNVIRPVSRTFIPSRVGDNLYLAGTDYERTLQALPEPLRSQMLHGDFSAGRKDAEWQVIPTAWIKAAISRWKPLPPEELGEITSVGVDPSGGGDEAPIVIRRGWRFDKPIVTSSETAAHGGRMAQAILDVCGDNAPVHIDAIGIGGSTCDHLGAFIGKRVVPVNFSLPTTERDITGKFKFANIRAAAYWRMREALAPERVPKLALPPDQRLLADLAAPRYHPTARGIQIESKDDIKKRLGRSPDRGDATVLCAMRTPILIDRNERREREHAADEA